MLRPYGVHSRTVRFDDGSTPKGFLREQFEARLEPLPPYFPPLKTPQRHNPLPERD